jgi:hypothetical protein
MDNTQNNDGNDALGAFLTKTLGLSAQLVQQALEKVRKENASIESTLQTDELFSGITTCLLDSIVHTNVFTMEQLQEALLAECKLPYVPLSIFDADVEIVKLLPKTITMGRLIAPFDMTNGKIMVAIVNPFDKEGKQMAVDFLAKPKPSHKILWYLTDPAGITRLLSNAYHLRTDN